MKMLSFIIQSLFTLLLIGIAGLFLIPVLPIEKSFEIRIVESGSMEPAIKTGSLVFIAPASSYQIGDIITFTNTSAAIPTTHRITAQTEENGRLLFTTKGDANEEADTNLVPATSVIGKVWVALPQVGFILDFARQPLGFVLLIVLPALMIIFGEVEKIWQEVRRKKVQETVSSEKDRHSIPIAKKRASLMIEIERPVVFPVYTLYVAPFRKRETMQYRMAGQVVTVLVVSLLSACFIGLHFVGSTLSYFNDVENTTNNTFETIPLDFMVTPNTDTLFSFALNETSDTELTITPEFGSANMIYTIETNLVGDEAFCEYVLVDTDIYNGQFLSLNVEDILFAAPWELSFSFDENNGNTYPVGTLCEIELIFTAHHDESTDFGYNDEETLLITFALPDAWVAEPELQPLFDMFVLPLESIVEQATSSETMEVVETNVVIKEEEEEPAADLPQEIIETPPQQVTEE